MSSFFARMLLHGYRLTGAAVYPMLGPYLSVRAAKGKEERARRSERYGRSKQVRPGGPLIWFHAASVGETVAIIPLIEEVVRRGIAVVVTTGTVTSANIANERLGEAVIHQYVPLDLKPAVSNFLNHWRPDLVIISESEIWPMTILELGARRIPQILVNGRISDKSFATWSRSPKLADALFENLSHVVAQTELDATRFSSLGANPVTVSGNLKVDSDLPPVKDEDFSLYSHSLENRTSWAAISTFDGEEEIVADAHKLVSKNNPDSILIIVPRHVERADAIEKMLNDKGLKVARKSKGEPVTKDIDVLLGDTTGEMGLYLRLVSIVFVGKSIKGEGGQNPIEPAMLETAILTGPNVQNFREAFRTLLQNNAARIVKDTDTLAQCVEHLMSNEDARQGMIDAGLSTVQNMRGSLEKTIQDLEPYLTPLVIESSLERQKPIKQLNGMKDGV
jgi:3-deoxy-D-manno-octulosonic-acid transferase